MHIPLSKRLKACCNFIAPGDRVADIGCDHGYLGIHLLTEGIAASVIAADVNEGPLQSAKENACAEGLNDKITFLLTNGLCGVMPHRPTDIAICGMGGELIGEILTSAPDAHIRGVRFLLQPMTRQEHLRKVLAHLGFAVTDEQYTVEGDKAYLVIACEYTGESHEIDEAQALLGLRLYKDTPMSDAERAYFLKKEKALLRRRDGRARGEEETTAEDMLLSHLFRLHTKE